MKTFISEPRSLKTRNYVYEDKEIKGILIFDAGTILFRTDTGRGFFEHHEPDGTVFAINSIEVEEPITSKRGLPLADRLQHGSNFIMDGFLYLHKSSAKVERLQEQVILNDSVGAMLFTPFKITMRHSRIASRGQNVPVWWFESFIERSEYHYQLTEKGTNTRVLAAEIKALTGIEITLVELTELLRYYKIERRQNYANGNERR